MSDAYPVRLPPTQDELPFEDDQNMETERHRLQMELLIETLQPQLRQRPGGGYVGGNMFVYFSLHQVRHQDFRGPDVFVVLDVPPGERKSWVVWEEGKGPDLVIELLSPSTAEDDKQRKKNIYFSQLRVAEYYWYDPFDPQDFAGFERQSDHYQALRTDSQGNLPSKALGLSLCRWSGFYRGTEAVWLRWMDAGGELLPTGEERADRARQEADRARQEADRARQEADRARQALTAAEQAAQSQRERAELLAAKLRALGLDPDDLDSAT